ncbi:MAG: cbb3-type cytochrome c oxidase N-terminal domain-containing protein [Chitinophagaceae bacterium]
MKYFKNILQKPILWILIATPSQLFAAPPKVSELTNPTAQILLGVVVALAICIVLLAYVVLSAAQLHTIKIKQEKNKAATKALLTLVLVAFGSSVFAADGETTKEISDTIAGIKSSSFYALIATIAVEITILFFLIANLRFLLKSEKEILNINTEETTIKQENKLIQWWDKVNSFRPIKEEAQIDLGHNYDGIRELDNKLPGWWLYGFYCCILFACIYLWRFHVSHTGLSSKGELQVALAKGEKEKEEYLKNAANNVDEKTVKFLDAEADLAAGKTLFTQNCSSCHGDNANGLVNGNPGTGPNLTDNYWLHKGSINDIFYSIKYGWQDKGMKPWKEDFSPIKIAQLASYIKSMQGKNTSGKEPQGDLFAEGINTTTDTTKINMVVDSVNKAAPNTVDNK